MNKPKHAWGDYYYKNKKDWRLELLHNISQSIPSFSEVFDEESFYVFVVIVLIASIFLVIFLSKIVGVTIKEHHLVMERDWGEPKFAHPFTFPWQNEKKEK